VSLSAELTAAAESERRSPLGLSREAQLFDRAAAVCAAVEAFQEAEQARKAALVDQSAGSDERFDRASDECAAAKARLLEVNLG